MGLLPSQSILEDIETRGAYYETKKQIEKDFENANLDAHFDFDKRVYLDEIQKHMEVALVAFNNKQMEVFSHNILAITYLSILKQEFQLTMKLYNILGHVLMTWKMYSKGYEAFRKLKDVAKMAQDLETSMYALKQMGYCLHQIKDY